MSDELKALSNKDLILKLRAEMHDFINIISRFDSFNRKFKKGIDLDPDQKTLFDQSVTDAKLSVGKMRDALILLDDKINE